MFEYSDGQFDVDGKSGDWHTAFYYLAEHVRLLSDGRINHKELYSLVGVDGRYVNHSNPLVRKRTAGALSRIVHTRRYAQDMRTRYLQSGLVFDHAAREVCSVIFDGSACSDDVLTAYLEGPCWESVFKGLENERASWRGDIDLFRARWEMMALFSETNARHDDSWRELDSLSSAETIMSALFHVITFGHLDFAFARSLIDSRPTGPLVEVPELGAKAQGACIIKFSDANRSAVIGSWPVPTNRPFIIGRYTDCDIVETSSQLSRLHCCVYSLSGVWCFEDMGSRNGSVIVREGEGLVFDSARDGARVPFVLCEGDSIVLADHSHFWFGALQKKDLRFAVVPF